MLIGLTGQIGAGKTTVARMLAAMGAVVIDADRIGREVVERTPALLKRLAREFGSDILTPTGRLRRKRLAELAFASDERKAALNRLVHPYLLRELRRQVRAALRTADLVVIDAALLLHWGMDDEVDEIWVVHASLKDRLARLAERGISAKDALARQRAQLPFAEFRRRADRVLLNNTSTANLEAKVRRLVGKIGRGAH